MSKPTTGPGFAGEYRFMSSQLQDDRREIYAQAAAVLDEDHLVPGAEALFDQALTNGLLVIAAAVIPGHAAADDPPRRRLPSAADLLTALAAHAGDAARPTIEIPLGGSGDSGFLLLEAAHLQDAVRRTQAARHGRGPGGQVTTADVEALLALDKHPALQAIAGHYLDKNWRQAQVADQIERSRAADFLDNLDSNEISRRVREAERVSGFHEDELEPQECPVCGHNTLLATVPDDFGYGTTAGTCVVCSYHRSDDAAYEKNLDQEWRARWE